MWNDDLKLRLIKVHNRVHQHSSVREKSVHACQAHGICNRRHLSGSGHPLLPRSRHLQALPAAGHQHYLGMQLLQSGA
jgi:hypothetical protein